MELTKLETLNILRRRKGITIVEMARKVKLSPGYIGLITSGTIQKISAPTRQKIASALQVPENEIFRKDDSCPH